MNLEQGDPVAAMPYSVEQRDQTEFSPKQWGRLRFYGGTIILDSAIIIASFSVANLFHGGRIYPADGLMIATVLLPLYLLISLYRQSYSSELLTDSRKSAGRSVGSFAVATLALLFIAFYLHAILLLSREIFTLGGLLSVVALAFSRYGIHRLAKTVFDGHPLSELIIADGVRVNPQAGATVIDARMWNIAPNMSDPHMLDRLGRLLEHADRVIVACPVERRIDWAFALKGANIRGELLVPEMDPMRPLGSAQFGDDSTLLISVGPLSIGNRALKRGLDLSVATVALVFLGPLMILTAVSIALESKGSVLFRQNRVGRGNRLFSIYKFRSMRVEASDANANTLTARGDSRVTRVGRIIRATSIDELPQILNVIKGDMSLVGPRPHALGALAGDQLYWEVDERYWHRHSTKPGITGLAQVLGFRGNTHLPQDLVNRLQADLDYIHGWTIWRDMRILVKTLTVVVHKNAY